MSAVEMDAATVLEEAADLLLMKGRARSSRLVRGTRGEVTASRCALEAVAGVVGLGHWSNVLNHPSVVAVARHLGPDWQPITNPTAGARVWHWNDKTTDDFEVIDTLRLVAKNIRNEAKP